ncbi:hypothetical protein TYRP_018730 [Tyrophagus putrescentiae]|nr:hypothetical protein TYRP_018730 [Tyrophagus putrescentiae]
MHRGEDHRRAGLTEANGDRTTVGRQTRSADACQTIDYRLRLGSQGVRWEAIENASIVFTYLVPSPLSFSSPSAIKHNSDQ